MKRIGITILACSLILSVALLQPLNTLGATYTYTQSSWTGGTDGDASTWSKSASTWTKYSTKDASTTILSNGIVIASTTGSVTQATSTGLASGTLNTATLTNPGIILSTSNTTAEGTWTTLTQTPAGIGSGGYLVYPGSGDYIYTPRGSGTATFYRYSISGNSWAATTSLPAAVQYGGSATAPTSGNAIYVVRGDATTDFYKLNYNTAVWTAASSIPGSTNGGSNAVYVSTGDYIYLLRGGTQRDFYRYSVSGNSWSTLTSTPATIASGGALVYTGGDYIYAFRGNSTAEFYRYSISGNSWTSMHAALGATDSGAALMYPGSGDYIYASRGSNTAIDRYSISGDSWTNVSTAPGTIGAGGSVLYPGSDNDMYVLRGNPSGTATRDFWKYTFRTAYASSGDFTSSTIDLGQKSVPTTFSYTATTPSGTSVKFQIRSSTTSGGLSSATWYGPTGTGDYYTSSGQTINSVHSGDRYFQYKAFLTTTDPTATPTFTDATIAYYSYATSTTLTSSAFNTEDAGNIVYKIEWAQTVPTNTTVKFQLRTAASSGGLSSATWYGPDGTNSTYFTSNSGGDTIPAVLSSGGDDQWIQYKMFLATTDTSVTPRATSVTITYVVNDPPEFNPDYPSVSLGGSGASETLDGGGVVGINYSVRDPDTESHLVTPSFQYSVDNGSTWSAITSGYLESTDLDPKTVGVSSYNIYGATWNAKGQIPGQYYVDTVKVRVVIDDGQLANRYATSTTAAFTLDTKNPTLGDHPIVVDASQSPALVTLSATDDATGLQMKVGQTSNLSDATYGDFASTTHLSISDNNGSIYARFKDRYGNETAIQSLRPFSAPQNMFFQDISVPSADNYRIFVAWGSQNIADFEKYNVYRSVDGGEYLLLTSNTDSRFNYIVDTGLESGTLYSYKVSAEDTHGNISFFSSVISDTADGNGGTDLSNPIISSITASAITPTNATVSWNTDQLANSTVYYVATTTYPGTDRTLYSHSSGIPTMSSSHSVTLSGLSPGTQYYYLIESADPSGNTGSSVTSEQTFETSPGPIISGVTTPEINDEDALIVWSTNIAANSIVAFSTNSDMSDQVEVSGTETLSTNHSVTVTGLTSGTKYYFYVKSTDADSNIAVDKNVTDGTIQYYTFTTGHDTISPVISGVSTALIGETGATITWTTDEQATSQIDWGLTPSLSNSTTETSTYTREHAVVLSSLATTTSYYYQVRSKDRSGNTVVKDDNGSPYSFTTLSPSTATTTVTEYIGGGGYSSDNRDLSTPAVLDFKVASVGPHSATVTFTTSKIANELVEYGESGKYDLKAGNVDAYRTTHSVSLSGLSPSKSYSVRATVVDVYKNKGYSSTLTFETPERGSEVAVSSDNNTDVSLTSGDLLKLTNASASSIPKIFDAISKNSNLASVSETDITESLADLVSGITAAPSISGTDIVVETGSRTATISWTTDRKSNSLVNFSKADEYRSDADKPYAISAGSPDESTLSHRVTLENLEPNTVYHYQIRSQGKLGPVALSTDRTFTTEALVPRIKDARFDAITDNGAKIHWLTDAPTKTKVEIKNSSTGQVITKEDATFSKDHVFEISDLDVSTDYTASIRSIDGDGNTSNPTLLPFSTSLSKNPPVISGIKATTSLIPGRTELAQTIISWKTDKPSTSRVYYTENTKGESNQSTALDSGLTKDHIVITTILRPGTVNKIEVESIDSSGHVVRSSPYLVLTPKPKGSVIDVIFKNLDDTFGFLGSK